MIGPHIHTAYRSRHRNLTVLPEPASHQSEIRPEACINLAADTYDAVHKYDQLSLQQAACDEDAAMFPPIW